MHTEDWINDVVMQRFDKLAAESDQLSVLKSIEEYGGGLEQEILNLLNEEDKKIFKELLDLHMTIEFMKKEWIYVKGIQDGMRFLTQLYES